VVLTAAGVRIGTARSRLLAISLCSFDARPALAAIVPTPPSQITDHPSISEPAKRSSNGNQLSCRKIGVASLVGSDLIHAGGEFKGIERRVMLLQHHDEPPLNGAVA
jgi:hypothetical protein